MVASRQWRELERVVASIERALAGATAVVQSPGRIRDEDGDLREVDVTIRDTVGSASVLVIIECRRRGKRQDKRWMEELAGKRASLGANAVIAVSSSDFSGTCKEAARRFGVELRTLRELDGHNHWPWFKDTTTRINGVNRKLTRVFVEVYPDQEHLIPTTLPRIEGNDRVFSWSKADRRVSALELFELIRIQNPELDQAILRRAPCEHTFNAKPQGAELLFHLPSATLRVATAHLTLLYSVQESPTSTELIEYKDGEGVRAEQARVKWKHGAIEFAMVFTRDTQSGSIGVTIDAKSMLKAGENT